MSGILLISVAVTLLVLCVFGLFASYDFGFWKSSKRKASMPAKIILGIVGLLLLAWLLWLAAMVFFVGPSLKKQHQGYQGSEENKRYTVSDQLLNDREIHQLINATPS
jgi:hypothetical protein